jgi:hypothetical protein
MSRELKLSIVAGIAFFLGATFRTCAPVHAQDVGSIDVVMVTAATAGATDGPQRVQEKSPDYVGVDLLAQWEGDIAPKISRFHDRQSGIEFICVRDRGCVLTGRSWK